jgi:integral membrane protein (TIGR01906 family)
MGLLKALSGISSVLMIVSVLAILYTGASLTTMTDTEFYLSEFEKTRTYDNFDDRNEPVILARELTSYFRDGSTWPPDIIQFTVSESLHLRDVKLIVLTLKAVFYFSVFLLAACLLLVIALFKGKFSRDLPWLLIRMGLSVIGTCLGFSLMALGFTTAFTLFHRLFFPQGNWQFPVDSTLIRLFPQQFFQDAFLSIILRIGFFGLLLLSLGLILRRIRKQGRNNQKEL